MSIKRNIYDEAPFFGKMTQGSIITGCIAESFPGEEVYGFIITPRCDLEHSGKVSTVHYVPVVPFERWFEVVARPIVKNIWKKGINEKLNTLFSQAKVGEGVMSANLSYEELIIICEAKLSNNKKNNEIRQKLDEYFDKDEAAFDSYILNERWNQKHEVFKYLSRLESNGIPSYYAIEGWPECSERYLVLMLRDVRRIQYDVAMKIKSGVEEGELNFSTTIHNDLFLTEGKRNFYCVEAQVRSPFVEHIMQAFVYNFSRIGVDDCPGNTVDIMFDELKNKMI